MKIYFDNKAAGGFAFVFKLILLLLCLPACNKVADHYTEVAHTPYVSLTNFPDNVLVGDTVSVQGKLFIAEGGVIQVGGVDAVFVSKESAIGSDGIVNDQVRFVITKEMGTGAVPAKLIVNSTTIELPVIHIRQYAGIPQRTDTTLYVEEIARYQPADLAIYQATRLSLLISTSTDANGVIWFDNPLGIFRVNGASIGNIIHAGDQLHDQAGMFVINRIIGSVISYDGTALSFSAAVSDNDDTLTNYVFRLCKYDVRSKAVTTLNRTLVSKIIPATDALPGAFEGVAANLHMVAMSLRTDVNDNLYFNNAYEVPSPNADPAFWYDNNVSIGYNPQNAYVIDNICKLAKDGKVSSLFSLASYNPAQSPLFKVPGFPLVITSDYKVSQDGSTAYVYDQSDGFSYSLLQYDLGKNIPLRTSGLYPYYKALSYDTAAASTYSGQIFVYFSFGLVPVADYSLLPLPNGTILTGINASIAALNNLDLTAYAFAGTEIGLTGAAPPSQVQTTGKAKDVVFGQSNAAAELVFSGVDRSGAVYYVTSPSPNDLQTAPLVFSRIYSKK